MLSPKRHYKVSDIFNHATDDDMIFCKHGVFHRIENDITHIYWDRSILKLIDPLTINVVKVNIVIVITFKSMKFCSNYGSVLAIETLVGVAVVILVHSFFKNCICIFI